MAVAATMNGSAARSILLVGGVAGSGKSTFIRSLAKGRTTPEIMQLLPDDACHWTLMNNRDLAGLQDPDLCERQMMMADRNLIVHLDFTFRVSANDARDVSIILPKLTPNLDDHPAWSVLKAADRVSLVLVQPTVDDLLAQVERRVVLNSVVPWMRRVVPLAGSSDRPTLAMKLVMVVHRVKRDLAKQPLHSSRIERLGQMYAMPDRISELYDAWRDYLQEFLGDRLAGEPLVIEPVRGEPTNLFRQRHSERV